MLDPAGPQAEAIRLLHRMFVEVCTVVYVGVVVVLGIAVWRGIERRAHEGDAPMLQGVEGNGAQIAETERKSGRWIAIATGATLVVLLVLLVASTWTGRLLAAEPEHPLLIEVTGHQWWWEIRYIDPVPSLISVTANELHLPVGRPVRIRLRSSDVIHSFWVPKLHGKTDLIPGEERFISMQVDEPGVFRGQCAEFCGYQHAHMALRVVAEAGDVFESWLNAQRKPSQVPQNAEQQRGFEVFEHHSCPMCHAIQGTEAFATRAPDLSHLAGRTGLAAETLSNTSEHLAAWIRNPQAIKPGVNMPPNELSPDDLRNLVTYLESLQ
jgi:cytochrome c oxidase subunit 2